MRFTTLVTLTLGIILGAVAVSFVHQPAARAAEDRAQRMDQSKWTTGDYARDALDHLKKAEEDMHKVVENDNSKVAKEASKLSADARAKVDEFVSELDAKKK
jgi:uncharacterized membrane-anchored protein YhcB (DUF1043 family)